MNTPDMISNNPNATVAASSTGLAAVIAYLVQLAFDVAIPAELAIVAAGLLTTIVLAVGRKGVRGIVRTIWAGNG